MRKFLIAAVVAAAALVTPATALASHHIPPTAPGAAPPHPVDLGKGRHAFKDEKGHTRYTADPETAQPSLRNTVTTNGTVDAYLGLTGRSGACVDDTTNVNRIKIVEAIPTGYTGDTAADRSFIANNQMPLFNDFMYTKIGAQLKLGCDSLGNLAISTVTITNCTPSAACDFASISNGVRTALGADAFKKYLIFYPVAQNNCGIGEEYNDDRTSRLENKNAANGDVQLSMAAVVWRSPTGFPPNDCWTDGTAAHEVLHTLGSVNNSAPHATGGGHCWDGWDLMCYNDGGPNGSFYNTTSTGCPDAVNSPTDRVQLDCPVSGYKDDYARNFNAGAVQPAAGSYANNRWLVTDNSLWWSKPANVAPATPSSLVVDGSATGTNIPVKWNSSTDDNGIAHYEVFRDGVSLGTTTPTLTATQQYVFQGLSCGTSYTLGVEAIDSDGTHSARTSITASTTTTPCTFGTFDSAADAFTDTTFPNANRGTLTYVRTQGGSPTRDGFWRFNTDGNTGVTSVKLHLCQFTSLTDSYTLSKLTASPDPSWGETSLTWNSMPAFTSVATGTLSAGCHDYDVPTSALEPSGPTTFVMTRSGPTADFGSKETTDTTKRPQLIVA